MKRKTIIHGVAIYAIHFLLTMGLVVLLLSSGMARMDTGVLPGSSEAIVDGILSTISDILMQPGMSIYDAIPVRLRHNMVEWSLMVVSSLLWGFSAVSMAPFSPPANGAA